MTGSADRIPDTLVTPNAAPPQRSVFHISRRGFVLGAAALATPAWFKGAEAATPTFDVVVYGGTSAGVVATLAAAQEGRSVCLIMGASPLGGMTANGLGHADARPIKYMGGLTRRFFVEAGKAYGLAAAYEFEPHVAEAIFRAMLVESGAVVYALDLASAVPLIKTGNRISLVRLTDGTRIQGTVYIDCSYEGDLMAASGVSWSVGRESRAAHGEPLAGYGVGLAVTKASALDAAGNLRPFVKPMPNLAIGAADAGVQAFNYRLCMTSDPLDRLAVSKPAGYDPNMYLIDLERGFFSTTYRPGGQIQTTAKYDQNNNDLPGVGWDYATSSRTARAIHARTIRNYVQGRLYFQANDPRVPAAYRDQVRAYGLAKSEFTGNGNWPRQLYIREGRRLNGMIKLDQNYGLAGTRTVDGAFLWNYVFDSHAVQMLANAQGKLVLEGNTKGGAGRTPVSDYHVPLRALMPIRSQCGNLVVPVCASVTRVMNCSYRMEPAYMMASEAAAVLAATAVKLKRDVQLVDRLQVVERLRVRGAVL